MLVDGAETQLDLVEASAAAYGVDVTVILDIIHVVEYVWKAGHVFHREWSPELECWVWTRVRSIIEGKSSKVAAAMRRAATVAGLSSDTRQPVDTCADYLLNTRRICTTTATSRPAIPSPPTSSKGRAGTWSATGRS